MNRFGVGERTILLWIASGQLKAVNVARNPGAKRPSWRFTSQSVADFEAMRTNTPAVPATRRRRKRTAGEVIEFIK